MEIEINEVEILKSEKLSFFARLVDAFSVVARAFIALIAFFVEAPALFVGSLITIALILAAAVLFWILLGLILPILFFSLIFVGTLSLLLRRIKL